MCRTRSQRSSSARRVRRHPRDDLHQILEHLSGLGIRMYRMTSDIAPYATHPDMPQFHGMVRESAAALRTFGARARELDIRLSFHPSQFVVLNSPDPELVRRSAWDLASQAEMLDLMELDDEAVLVIHVGGAYGDRRVSAARWVETWKTLPAHVRRRLVLEHDDLRFSASDTLWIHEHTGVRLVFDYQHFWCFNPEGLALRPTVEAMLRTWPVGVRPKIHFSSPRTELREMTHIDRRTRRRKTVLAAPVWTGHADFCNPFEFATFMRDVDGLDFDVMLEAKAKDLALMRLRPDLVRYAPDVARRFGLGPEDLAALATEVGAVIAEGKQNPDDGA